jgi:dihydrofolate reductase
MITLVVAYERNTRIIGHKGSLPPWRLKDDLAHFKETTFNKTVVLGTTTLISLPQAKRPLPDRTSIVIGTSSVLDTYKDIMIVRNPQTLIDFEKRTNCPLYVIGGAQIYKLFLPHAHNIIASIVDAPGIAGDVHFPNIDMSQWTMEVKKTFDKGERNSHSFSIVHFTKNAPL